MDKKNLIEVVSCVKSRPFKDDEGKDVQLFRCQRLVNGYPINDEFTTSEIDRGFYYPRVYTKIYPVMKKDGTVVNMRIAEARIGEPYLSSI